MARKARAIPESGDTVSYKVRGIFAGPGTHSSWHQFKSEAAARNHAAFMISMGYDEVELVRTNIQYVHTHLATIKK